MCTGERFQTRSMQFPADFGADADKIKIRGVTAADNSILMACDLRDKFRFIHNLHHLGYDNTSRDMDAFVSWFQSKDGTLDAAVGLADIPGHGRGAVALKDIPVRRTYCRDCHSLTVFLAGMQKGHTLFSIPRDITLSTRTSVLPGLLGSVEWKRFKLDEGWAGLILCMLWEEAQGPLSKWAPYFCKSTT